MGSFPTAHGNNTKISGNFRTQRLSVSGVVLGNAKHSDIDILIPHYICTSEILKPFVTSSTKLLHILALSFMNREIKGFSEASF